MTGEAEFNEVYFTDVRIPDAERLGDVGEGWRVSLTTLMNERVSIGGAIAPKGSGAIASRGQAVAGHARRQREAGAAGRADEALDRGRGQSAHQHPGRSRPARWARPVPRARSASSRCAESNKRIYEFAMNLMGADGMLYGELHDAPPRARDGSRHPAEGVPAVPANSIEGGTSEVMRNILGERVLGLPGDVAGRQGRALELGAATGTSAKRRATSRCRAGLRVSATEARRVATSGSLDLRAARSGTRRLGPSATQRPSRARAAGTRSRAADQHPGSTRSRPRAHGPGRIRPAHGNTSRGR